MKKRSSKKTNNSLEIGDKIGIVISFNYLYHKQNPKSDSKCKDIIKEMGNQHIEKVIKSKILKIINEWISDLNYGNITNKTINIKIPSVKLKIKPSDIKKIEFVNTNNNDVQSNEECIYHNSKQVMILLVTKLVTNKTKDNNILKQYNLPSLKSVDKVIDSPEPFFNIVRSDLYHHSKSSGILNENEKNNLLFDKILFKLLRTGKIY